MPPETLAQIASLNKMAGIELLPVPYKGVPATITDVLGGVLDATLVDPGNALAQVKGGQLRALGVTSLKRNSLTPDWPAISETLPGFDFSSWTAVVCPAGMPRELVARLNDDKNPARVADVGCGVGWAAIELAKAFPHARIDGLDADEESISQARRNAADHGVADRVTFEVVDASSDGSSDTKYDLILFLECVHDMGRPVEALAAARK